VQLADGTERSTNARQGPRAGHERDRSTPQTATATASGALPADGPGAPRVEAAAHDRRRPALAWHPARWPDETSRPAENTGRPAAEPGVDAADEQESTSG